MSYVITACGSTHHTTYDMIWLIDRICERSHLSIQGLIADKVGMAQNKTFATLKFLRAQFDNDSVLQSEFTELVLLLSGLAALSA